MKHWPAEIKEKARKFRLAGTSFGEITKELNIPKSTLSLWFKNIPKPNKLSFTNRKEWLKEIRHLAAVANKNKRQNRLNISGNEVIQDISTWKNYKSIETQKIMLAMLYWAEGSKGRQMVVFANTDPKLSLLFITLLRNCFAIDESKLRVRIHLHDYHKEKDVKKFWSNLLQVPESQFNKCYLKKRSKQKVFRRNIGGICFIKYNSVYLQEKIMQYAYNIADKLVSYNVPVAQLDRASACEAEG